MSVDIRLPPAIPENILGDCKIGLTTNRRFVETQRHWHYVITSYTPL
jgi:hypothetical protein